jgi:protein QN1
VADSKESEYITSLPLKMNANAASQDLRHVNQFFEKNDNAVLQKKTHGSMESSCPTVVEEHVDKMCLDILRKKISVNSSLPPQDDKINEVSVYNLN